jgi:ribosomal protein S18 acetylase RimI-like enzyme
MTNERVVLREGTDADEADYRRIAKAVESPTFHANADETIKAQFQKGPVFIVEFEGKTAGVIACEVASDAAVYFEDVVIDPAFHGKGLGRAALEEVIARMSTAPRMWLMTHPNNTSAVKLYSSLGFREVERIENYFGDGEPRIKMVLEKKPEESV